MFAELAAPATVTDQVELYAYALADSLGGVQTHPEWYTGSGTLVDVARVYFKNLAFEDMKKPRTPAGLQVSLKYVMINISDDLAKQAAGKRTVASTWQEAPLSDAGLQAGVSSAELFSLINQLVHPVYKTVAPVTSEQAMQIIATQGVPATVALLRANAQPSGAVTAQQIAVPAAQRIAAQPIIAAGTLPKLSSEDITTFAPATPVYASIPAPTLAPGSNYLLWGGAALLLVLLLRR